MLNKKILIVDDEETIVTALVKKFTQEGYQVETAIDGKEGLEKVKLSKPDLILLDIVLPVMDGMTVLHKLKEDENTKDVPVIILTNLDDSAKVEESHQNGVFDYLVKTAWTLDEIAEKVKKVLIKD